MNEIRAPALMRLSTSRPRLSVPSRCSMLPPSAQAGGLKAAPRSSALGSNGARSSPPIAAAITRARISAGIQGKPLVRAKPNSRAANGRGMGMAAGSAMADTRVDQAIAEIDEKVGEHEQNGGKQDAGLDDREVAGEHGFEDEAFEPH